MSIDPSEEGQLPSQSAVLLEMPLYTPLDVGTRPDWMRVFRNSGFQFDAHCVYCKDKTPFKVSKGVFSGTIVQANEYVMKAGQFSVQATCTRYGHSYVYYFKLADGVLSKIGQMPSLEDIAGADIDKYRAQLKDGAFSELRKATGLASHGIGIGAFVYLRRIFERLIHEHRERAEETGGPIEGFDGLRMEEKIMALKSVLPAALVKHRSAYSILSKGLHELTEQECKLYFPVVRTAIIRMLEEDWIQRERDKTEASLEKQLADIARAVNKPPSAPKAGE